MPKLEEVQLEVKNNLDKIISAINSHNYELVYVDGKLYNGKIIFDGYKGIGWQDGRMINIELDSDISSDSDVILVSLAFGRLRHCKKIQPRIGRNLKPNHSLWKLIELNEDRE